MNEQIEKLKNFPTIGEMINYINHLYPSWIKSNSSSFSKDYDILNINWNGMCKKLFKTTTKCIILVEQDEFKSDSSFLETSCDILTNCGFLIRNENNYIKCENCNKLIPTESEIEKIKMANKKISTRFPKSWKPCCTDC